MHGLSVALTQTSMYNLKWPWAKRTIGTIQSTERSLQLRPRSRLFLQSLGIQLVQESAVELDGRRALQFETGEVISKRSDITL